MIVMKQREMESDSLLRVVRERERERRSGEGGGEEGKGETHKLIQCIPILVPHPVCFSSSSSCSCIGYLGESIARAAASRYTAG